MLVEHLLHLARVDRAAAAQDHVAPPVDQEEEPLLVHPPQVAGVEPAVADGFGGGVRVVPVALHHDWPADHDLAHLSASHRAAFLYDHSYLDAAYGPTHLAGPPGLAAPVRGGHRGRLA